MTTAIIFFTGVIDDLIVCFAIFFHVDDMTYRQTGVVQAVLTHSTIGRYWYWLFPSGCIWCSILGAENFHSKACN